MSIEVGFCHKHKKMVSDYCPECEKDIHKKAIEQLMNDIHSNLN
jgi:hypothetical protein